MLSLDFMTEKEIESQILRWMNFQYDVFAFKINTVGVYDEVRGVYRKNHNPFIIPGTSDILAIAYKHPIAIEVKTPKGMKSFLRQMTETERNQRAFLDKFHSKGGYSTAVSSLAQAIRWLEAIKNNTFKYSDFALLYE
jgi:hypothetical protein